MDSPDICGGQDGGAFNFAVEPQHTAALIESLRNHVSGYTVHVAHDIGGNVPEFDMFVVPSENGREVLSGLLQAFYGNRAN